MSMLEDHEFNVVIFPARADTTSSVAAHPLFRTMSTRLEAQGVMTSSAVLMEVCGGHAAFFNSHDLVLLLG